MSGNMRTKKEILNDLDLGKKPSPILELEVLIDIRDLIASQKASKPKPKS